jgi:hypothetical protein
MAGSITKQFDFIINSATHAVSKKCDLKLPRSTSFNYFVAESIIRTPEFQRSNTSKVQITLFYNSALK